MSGRAAGLSRFHGLLVIDKPAGWTSHDVVGKLRRLLGERRIGHAGTLDPAATGVLPLAVGDATKVIQHLSDASKTYLAEITLGVETDSYDLDGVVTAVRGGAEIDRAAVETALASFRGGIAQIPPMHSAIKIGGRRLYDLARAGQTIERAPRPVTIHEIALIDWSPPVATVCIDCSKGTYIRSVARDLGSALGTGAYLSNLVRLRTGPFSIEDAWTIAELATLDLAAGWDTIAVHPDAALRDLPALLIDAAAMAIWEHGGRLPATDGSEPVARVYSQEGAWLGIARFDETAPAWRPVKVIGAAA